MSAPLPRRHLLKAYEQYKNFHHAACCINWITLLRRRINDVEDRESNARLAYVTALEILRKVRATVKSESSPSYEVKAHTSRIHRLSDCL
jgi:hypothetical protein